MDKDITVRVEQDGTLVVTMQYRTFVEKLARLTPAQAASIRERASQILAQREPATPEQGLDRARILWEMLNEKPQNTGEAEQ